MCVCHVKSNRVFSVLYLCVVQIYVCIYNTLLLCINSHTNIALNVTHKNTLNKQWKSIERISRCVIFLYIYTTPRVSAPSIKYAPQTQLKPSSNGERKLFCKFFFIKNFHVTTNFMHLNSSYCIDRERNEL